MASFLVLRGRKLIDGYGEKPVEYPVIVFKDDIIQEVGEEDQIDPPVGGDVQEITLENGTILPGLIDSHIHLALGVAGSYSELMEDSDSIHLMTGILNAREALHSGVTTIKEAGARNRVAFDLREGWRRGLIQAPRMLISGRPLTITGGHFHFCNENEADGVDEVSKMVRRLVKEGVDLIKIMASGGGTGGTINRQASYREEELRAAVEEAHRLGRTTFAHCEAYASVGNAARAGVDVIEHCGFILLDGSRGFDKAAVKLMADKGLFYDPTLQTGSRIMDELMCKKNRDMALTSGEEAQLEAQEYKIRRKQENLKRMVDMGVQVVAGSDGIGLGNSTRLVRAMELMVEAGLTPMEVLKAGTINAARAIRMDHFFGSIKKGLKADIIVVEGDPSKDIGALRNIRMVMQEGKIIRLEKNSNS
jgi:imidazolonepropionase-like amidohydrolase